MQYDDPIYGRFTINEPILQDLIHSQAVQRLHGVLQHGITGLIGLTEPITRFEHSMGAMLIVRRLGGSVPEQIAALLHDVSHTAFSHVIDHVLGSPKEQSYHDEMKETYMATTDLPDILARHAYDWTNFVDEEAFSLLEQPAPRLCADRIDYFLRDCMSLGLATQADVDRAVESLLVGNGRIALNDLAVARWFGNTFMQADDASWANFREVGLYELTAKAIRRALALSHITLEDFWLTDDPLWQKLHAHPDAELQRLLKQVSLETQFVWDEENPTFRVNTKLRAIDPDVWLDGALRPLSTLDPDFATQRSDYLSRKQGSWPMRVKASNQ
ncbi:dNTP triphosphohydrolase, broad substrate specificity [hydrothermal vent metagenome]|uniref:DNTP triphosphohydrolase, broad substrate specificity n=1 Tax=hydrothermal vent metagenome TaxID=652676 RepID=A0A3B0W412_9ZZZZ